MMRRTATCAGLALALFLSSYITIEKDAEQVRQALDLDGIDAVVFQGDPPSIRFSSGPSAAEYDPSQLSKLVTLRKGRVLVIRRESDRLGYYYVSLPPTVMRVVADSANIGVARGTTMNAIELRVSGSVDWEGDIASLTILDASALPDCKQCSNTISIAGGRIRSLQISTLGAHVRLEKPDDLGQIMMTLGTMARYSLLDAKRPPNLRIVPHQDGIIAVPDPEQAAQ